MSVVCGLSAGDVVDAVEEARAAAAKQSDGLDDFQLIPKDADGNAKLKGLDLLNHLCRVRNMRSAVNGTGRVEPSSSLHLEIQSDALKMIQPTPEEMRHGAVMRDSFGDRAQRKCVQRKLNLIRAIVGTCTVVNSEENMDKMRKELQFAEAMAEYTHKKVREWWGFGKTENLSNSELIKEKYQGIRPASGYPCQPDHTEKDTIWKLLDVKKEIGLELTESRAMNPGSSVSGLYFSNPDSKYFNVGKLGKDQVEDYAKRKNWPIEEALILLRAVQRHLKRGSEFVFETNDIFELLAGSTRSDSQTADLLSADAYNELIKG